MAFPIAIGGHPTKVLATLELEAAPPPGEGGEFQTSLPIPHDVDERRKDTAASIAQRPDSRGAWKGRIWTGRATCRLAGVRGPPLLGVPPTRRPGAPTLSS